jgi:hypothetical protein
VDELATARANEETASSLKVRDVGAPTSLGTFACTEPREGKMRSITDVTSTALGKEVMAVRLQAIRDALRREQCGI